MLHKSWQLLEARTAYAKGFDKETTTMDELIDHFNSTNLDVVSVQMRNWCEKKGKVIICFFNNFFGNLIQLF